MDDPSQSDSREYAKSIRKIIDLKKWKYDIENVISERLNGRKQIAFICFSLHADDDWKAYFNVKLCIEYCRSKEQEHAFSQGEYTYFPLSILIALDSPPKYFYDWRTDFSCRSCFSNYGAFLIDRAVDTQENVDDDELFLEFISEAVTLLPRPTPNKLSSEKVFHWEPKCEVGDLGEEFAHQPPSIPSPVDDKEFIKRFEIYSQRSPDMEF